ncbi:hypothetical protein [Thalassoglobus neptunius]|uniref:hypothetical protein n=1 Tax=Thalassoglobus neptunius TaxID=1938619 RepID=UPI0018D2056F|nr:hypothetical protein [Thalassoglobus neptunius]
MNDRLNASICHVESSDPRGLDSFRNLRNGFFTATVENTVAGENIKPEAEYEPGKNTA